jgi:hypothetical protein
LQPQLTGLPPNAPQVAPLGQSLAELNQQRYQQQMQAQATGFPQQQFPQQQFQIGLMPQPTGFGQQQNPPFGVQQQQFGPPGQQFGTLGPQPTGFGGFPAPQQQPMQTGLPPALQPQRTAVNGYGSSISPPPVPPIPQTPTAAPLQPQKTGPAPSIRFGVKGEAKKLAPQPTGRANLAQASKCLRNICTHTYISDNRLTPL